MRTRLVDPHPVIGSRQARISIFRMRRGPIRRAFRRMINCDWCVGVGFMDFELGTDADGRGHFLRVVCGECRGGMTEDEYARQIPEVRARDEGAAP